MASEVRFIGWRSVQVTRPALPSRMPLGGESCRGAGRSEALGVIGCGLYMALVKMNVHAVARVGVPLKRPDPP